MILAFQNRKKISAFVEGCGATWTDLEGINNNTQWPMIFSGVTTMAPIDQARRYGLDYWYIDTGYLGNHKRKSYLRVCRNSIHATGALVDRPRDRLDRLQVDTARIQRGNDILMVPSRPYNNTQIDVSAYVNDRRRALCDKSTIPF